VSRPSSARKPAAARDGAKPGGATKPAAAKPAAAKPAAAKPAASKPAAAKPPATKPVTAKAIAQPTPAKAGAWTPTRGDVAVRKALIRRLIWLDTENVLQRIKRGAPRDAGETLQEQLRDLQRRSPLLQWHVSHNVMTPSYPQRRVPSYPQGGAASLSAAAAASSQDVKSLQLREALNEYTPILYSLVQEACAREPTVSARIYRKFARAGAVLFSWNCARLLKLDPKKKYQLMNSFLRILVSLVSECKDVLECNGNEECLVTAANDA
jgi:hypothetical protein